MCTLTWLRSSHGYELFFNRDELKSRAPEVPPAAQTKAGVRFLAPRDGAEGGTWLVVNEFGVSAALVNGGQSYGEPGAGERSRGLLVRDFATVTDERMFEQRLATTDCAPYRAFLMIGFFPKVEPLAWRWDGGRSERLAASDLPFPVTSSGFDPAAAARTRRRSLAAFAAEAGGLSNAVLERFHTSHGGPGERDTPSAASACMHRPDAATRSFCHISVDPEEATLRYAAGPACTGAPMTPLALPRRSTAAAG